MKRKGQPKKEAKPASAGMEFVPLTPEQKAEIDALMQAADQLAALAAQLRSALEAHKATAAAFWQRTFKALGIDPKRNGQYVQQLGAIQLQEAPSPPAASTS